MSRSSATFLMVSLSLVTYVFTGAGRVQAVTFAVDDPTPALGDIDEGNGVCATASGTCTLLAALQEANSLPGADTILVPPGFYVLDSTLVSEGLEIIGEDAETTVIDGNREQQPPGDAVFVTDDLVEFSVSRVTIQNGVGGIHARGHVTVTESVLQNHDGGAGIYCEGWIYHGSATVIDSAFERNGFGIYCDGPLMVEGSTFEDNHALNVGGGIWAGDDLVVSDSIFSGNSAGNVGGGISAERALTVTDSRFIANSAGNVGGGVWAHGRLYVGWSTFAGNYARNVGGAIAGEGPTEIVHSTISGNTVGNGGGGVYVDVPGTLKIANSTLSGNVALGSGAAIAAGGPADLDHITVTGSSSTCFHDPNCHSVLHGGAVVGANIRMGNSILYGNLETDCEGTIESKGNNLIGNTSYCAITGDTYGNLIGVDPLLGPLQDNGGPTLTHDLLEGSPAINRAGTCYGADQRGVPRPQGAACDIGAVERMPCDQDGVLDPGEQCDDGNALDGDGCSSTCHTELLTGSRLILATNSTNSSMSKVILLSKDPRISIGLGNYGTDDPVVYGGTLRIVSIAGDGFDDVYELPAENWEYMGRPGGNRGYKYKSKNGAIGTVTIQADRLIKASGRGGELGHSLGLDPNPVYVVVTIGSRKYSTEYGGTVKFRAGRLYTAKSAPAPEAHPDF